MPAVVPFGSYQLLMPLAVGGMAELFVAKSVREAGFEKLCVIKKVLPHLVGNRDLATMFLNEARLAAQLHHPGICQVFDLGREGADYYLAMEYLAGEDLSAILHQSQSLGRQVPFGVTAKIVALAAEALHYAHEFVGQDGARLELVHRDVSPSNLLVTYQGAVKVIDFGIAHAEALAPRGAEGQLRGKLAYMAPEVLRGERVTRAADVWGLGVCLFEMVTGRRLVVQSTFDEAYRVVVGEPVPRPAQINPAIPAELEDVVLKALAKEPDHRYPTAEALRSDLERFIADRTYVPQGVQLGGYLRELFGDERADRKLRPALVSPAESSHGPGTLRFDPPPGELPTVVSAAHLAPERPIRRAPATWVLLLAVASVAGMVALFAATRSRSPVAPAATVEQVAVVRGSAAHDAEPTPSQAIAVPAKPTMDPDPAARAQAASTGASGAASEPIRPAADGPPVEAASAQTSERPHRTRTSRARAGELQVTSNVPVEVSIDGVVRGQTPLRVQGLPRGTRTLKLENRQLGISRRVRVRIDAGERATYQATFTKGRLNVVVHPWADVWLDGTPLGQTPLAGRELWEGRHTLRLVNPKGEKTLPVDIIGGQTTVVRETIR